MAESFKKRVKLVAWLQNPDREWDAEDSASCGARGCFSELSSSDIHEKEIVRPDYDERKEAIFRETSGRGHGAVLDLSAFAYSIDNLTRASTLFLCGPQYASHLQQSLRRATAKRGFHLPKGLNSEAEKMMEEQFDLYEKMQSSRIPSEDARFILPLYTKTTIETLSDTRELMHIQRMSENKGIPSEVRDTIKQMVDLAYQIAPKLMKERESNYEVLAWFPSSQLFAEGNKTIEGLIDSNGVSDEVILLDNSGIKMSSEQLYDAVMNRNEAELANMKNYHFTFFAPMSLACFHQATRQRTWDQSVQALPKSVERGRYVVPPKIKDTEFETPYRELSERLIRYVQNGIDNPEILGVLPHSLQVYDLIHINGWNAVHSIGKRTCTEAQWEIRNIANQMADKIKAVYPELGEYAVPQGITYGKCPERESCGRCSK